MSRAAACVMCGVLLAGLPGRSLAQTTIDGSAEVSVARSATASETRQDSNNWFGQNYALGWSSTVYDPRILKYNLQGIFRTSDLSASATGEDKQNGSVGDLGYRIGASLLPGSAIPFFFQTSRTRSRSSGDLGPSNPIRSGLIAASGAPPANFESLDRELSLGWNVGIDGWPRVELGYRRGNSVISGGDYQATQNDKDLSASVQKTTTSSRHVFRYQATDSENVLSQVFSQRLGLLDYDFGQTMTTHSRVTARAGRRATVAHSVFMLPVDPEGGAYAPSATTGSSLAEYAQGGYDYEPTGRFSVHATGGVDRQSGDLATTTAALASVTGHFEALRGLTLLASGTAGNRQEIVRDSIVTVSVRLAEAGASYQVNSRFLGAGASARRGRGTNTTVTGTVGYTDSWSGEAHVSTTIGWFGASSGYDRTHYRDDILDFGNYESDRMRASAQAQGTRGSLSINGEQLLIARGRGATYTRNLQHTLSSTASLRITPQSFLTATAGHYSNDFDSLVGPGVDRNFFWNVGVEASVRPSVHLSGWIRSEDASASRTQFVQDAVSAFARAEYRLRELSFALEYRRSRSQMQYPQMVGPDTFAGRQLRFSVLRQFGMRLR